MAVSEPLDKKFVPFSSPEGKSSENVSALDQRFKSDIRFTLYAPPPNASAPHAEVEEWLDRMTFINDDLELLLRMPHEKFWCQAVFDDSLHACVDSYLRLAPRQHDVTSKYSDDVTHRQQTLHKLFFFVCLRMATHKESSSCYFTPAAFGDILYNNFIFDVPKLLDICSLYGQNNSALLSKVISNIFTQQPKYFDDLSATLPTLIHIFVSTTQKCGYSLSVMSGGGASPQKLTNSTSSSRNKLVSMSWNEFKDVLLYICDIANTLHCFLDAFPSGAKVLFTQEFPAYLASFADVTTQAVSEAFRSIEWHDLNEKFMLKQYWNKTRVLLVTVFRQIVQHNCLQPLSEATTEKAALDLVEMYLSLISSVLNERRFMALYETLFPFSEDQSLIEQSPCDVDDTRLQFIRDGLAEAVTLFGRNKAVPPAASEDAGNASAGENQVYSKQTTFFDNLTDEQINAAMRDVKQPEATSVTSADEAGACAAQVSGVQLESLITAVKDLFPHLGEGYIERCLEVYAYSSEEVIGAILEDNLSPALLDLDPTLKRAQPSGAVEPPSLIEQRANIHDDDEFDLFRRDAVDLSRIHKGKKTKVTAAELEDKSDLHALKPLYEKYGRQFSASAYEPDDAYDDEYDDTYDTNLVGADDADSADELTNRRQFTVPRVLLGNTRDAAPLAPARGGDVTSSDDDSPNDGVTSQRQSWKQRDEFVQNPEEIRAKREAARARKAPPSGRHYEVKGREKGQGQEKDVLRNRAFKERNKNKQRRSQADKKRMV